MDTKFMNIEQLENYIPYKMSTIYGFVRIGSIPFFKPKGKLIFDKDEIDDWVRNDYKIKKDKQKPILYKNYQNGKN